jgi:hypothetical protein
MYLNASYIKNLFSPLVKKFSNEAFLFTFLIFYLYFFLSFIDNFFFGFILLFTFYILYYLSIFLDRTPWFLENFNNLILSSNSFFICKLNSLRHNYLLFFYIYTYTKNFFLHFLLRSFLKNRHSYNLSFWSKILLTDTDPRVPLNKLIILKLNYLII